MEELVGFGMNRFFEALRKADKLERLVVDANG